MSRKQSLHNVTIGADIEVFLREKTTNNVVTAEGIIRGSKDFPFRFMQDNQFFATSLDNIMAEFCIPPATNPGEFRTGIEVAMNYIHNTIPSNLSIWAFPSARVHESQLITKNALTFGCDPDRNAWASGEQNSIPQGKDSNLRSCGGHIHIGYDNPEPLKSIELAKAMDIFIGLPSILQEPDNERKTLYGKAGAFRWKDYGMEYRTVSNYYINSKELTHWAFDNTMCAVEWVNMENKISKTEADAIQLAINQCDKTLAETMCSYFGVKLAA